MTKIKFRHFASLLIMFFVLVSMLFLFTTHSDTYKEAELFAREDPQVADLIGHVAIVDFRFWDGFESLSAGSGREANFVFDVAGEKAKAILDIRLSRVVGKWYVDLAYLRFNGALIVLNGNHGDESSSSMRSDRLE
ncbi:MAG: hypothetical protein P4L77_14090 [Sulfuriferula sp.]|nr:hypothetical protein [Sulfuriferula sp.]